MEATPPPAVQPGSMATVIETIEIPISLKRLWNLIVGATPEDAAAAQQRLGKLVAVHAGFPDGAPNLGEIAPGTRFKERVTFMGMPADIDWTVSEWDPPDRIAMDGVGPMGSVLRVALSVGLMEGGVRWTHEISFGGGALAGMLPMIEKQIRGMLDETVAGLRALLTEPAAT